MSFAFAPQYSSSPLRPLEFSIAGSRQSFRHRRNLSQPRHPKGHASCPVSLEFEAPRFWVASCFFKVKIGRYSCRSFGHRKAGPMRENLVPLRLLAHVAAHPPFPSMQPQTDLAQTQCVSSIALPQRLLEISDYEVTSTRIRKHSAKVREAMILIANPFPLS